MKATGQLLSFTTIIKCGISVSARGTYLSIRVISLSDKKECVSLTELLQTSTNCFTSSESLSFTSIIFILPIAFRSPCRLTGFLCVNHSILTYRRVSHNGFIPIDGILISDKARKNCAPRQNFQKVGNGAAKDVRRRHGYLCYTLTVRVKARGFFHRTCKKRGKP